MDFTPEQIKILKLCIEGSQDIMRKNNAFQEILKCDTEYLFDVDEYFWKISQIITDLKDDTFGDYYFEVTSKNIDPAKAVEGIINIAIQSKE